MRSLAALIVLVSGGVALAETPPPPKDAHPRLLIDADLKGHWQAQAKLPHGPVVGAMALCDDAASTHEHDRALYQGQEWAKVEAACLIAWQATDKAEYKQTALRYYLALIDDLDTLGDGKGGDQAAWRDSGYAIRNLGPYTALGYDWLYDSLKPAERERTRKRWKSWLDWYEDKGYRAHAPGSNYHAGYLLSATMIAIAEGGEAGADGDALWKRVADQMWSVEMTKALAPGGELEGGDWLEGFQYGPLSIGEYALGARLMAKYGVAMPGIRPWLAAVLRRHVYALTPGEELYASGDTETESPHVPVRVPTLAAVILGDASREDKQWARGELARLKLTDKEYPLYAALAGVGDQPVLPPRVSWPTWYLAPATNNLYARTRWDDHAVWFTGTCSRPWDMDHRHVDAGNFVLSRGKDNVIVDPAPYGSLGTMTSNAPTVDSGMPDQFRPSQGQWGKPTFQWAGQSASGVLAARCDYASAFQFKETPSDIREARRDFVLLPGPDGTTASLVIVDDATTADAAHAMYLHFYTTGKLALSGTTATASVGNSDLSIQTVQASGGTPAIQTPPAKDCFALNDNNARGKCEAARFPSLAYRLQIPGPHPRAVNVISATEAGAKATAVAIKGDGWAGVHVGGTRDAVVVWPVDDDAKALKYRAPRTATTHVVLGVAGDAVAATGSREGDDCVIDVAPGGTLANRPLVLIVDAACAVALDPAATHGVAAMKLPIGKTPGGSAHHRTGCCSAQDGGSTSLMLGAIVVPLVVRRRRRPLRG